MIILGVQSAFFGPLICMAHELLIIFDSLTRLKQSSDYEHKMSLSPYVYLSHEGLWDGCTLGYGEYRNIQAWEIAIHFQFHTDEQRFMFL